MEVCVNKKKNGKKLFFVIHRGETERTWNNEQLR